MIKKYPEKNIIEHLFYYVDGNLFWKNPSSLRVKNGTLAGYLDKKGYQIVCISGKNYRVHRLIWILHNGDISENLQIDHINGIKNDNRIENLRLSTNSQNACNVGKKINNTSGVKNVCWNKEIEKWAAYITVNGKTKHLGYFIDKNNAIDVATKSRKLYHGEYSNNG